MKTIYILFGEMGCGKTYRGTRFAKEHGYKFLEGDDILSTEMIERVSQFKNLTIEMLDNYMFHLVFNIRKELEDCEVLAVSQALYLNKHRQFLIDSLQGFGYDVKMWWIQAPFLTNLTNLLHRKNSANWICYWLMNKCFFQKPTHEYQFWYD